MPSRASAGVSPSPASLGSRAPHPLLTSPEDAATFSLPGKNRGALSGSNSVVECNLAKVDVAGSNPVSRSSDNHPPGTVRAVFSCPTTVVEAATAFHRL